MNRNNLDSIVLNLRRLRAIDARFFQQYVVNKNIPYQHLMMIQFLCQDGPIPISRIKEVYHFSAPAATQLVTLLEKQGYLIRIKSEQDKRRSLIQLSSIGLKTLEDGAKFFEEGVTPLMEYLGEQDSLNFNRILERMIEYFDQNQDNNEKK
jgi:DNA-binding MarR family transcriptional regulator